jgi:hypothetical protein
LIKLNASRVISHLGGPRLDIVAAGVFEDRLAEFEESMGHSRCGGGEEENG